jgi:branched chain amino acid aminotransferase apoenzyme (EC 2.6.1.42)
MTDYYHVDGELVPAEEATVSVRDRGFMYGDAAFETLRAYGGELFEWDAHARRLATSCTTLGFEQAVPAAAVLHERVSETLSANGLEDAYVRLSVTRGVQAGKLTPGPADPTVVVIVSELPRGGPAGEPVWDRPATVETVTTRRPPDSAVPAGAKTHNYLNGILARLELEDADEALVRTTDGHVAEGATSNVWFVADETLYTPAAELPLLPGVTRAVVFELAETAGVAVEEGHYAPATVRAADEVFLTNSTWELRPVTAIDGTEIGTGPVTDQLQQLYNSRVEKLY